MHLAGIKKKDVAEKLKNTPEYVGRVLSGKETPKDAEQRFTVALDEILKERGGHSQSG